MKEFQGSAEGRLTATPQEAISLLAAVDRYPDWYPTVIREVDVLQRGPDGHPTRARTKVHLAAGPLAHDFQFEVLVSVEDTRRVTLTRVADQGSEHNRLEVQWDVSPGQLQVDLQAALDVPRFLPLGGIGNSVAQGFIEAATRALDGSSPKASASSS